MTLAVELKGEHTMWGEVRVGRRECVWSSTGASGIHGEEARLKLEAWARAERTSNMPYMLVTLDVSQLETSALKLRNLLKR
eukprot:scaffold110353_cov67-Phaeocystis_antarctica.AAC.1